MKTLLLTALLTTLSAAPAFADTAADLAAKGKAAYDARDYSAVGSRSADMAAELYGKAASLATNALEKAQYLSAQAQALYFVGDASDNDKVKVVKHDLGLKAADQALRLLGVSDPSKATGETVEALNPSDDQLNLIAEAFYQRASNLGQWGQANGIAQSLGKWPELRRNAEVIEAIGLESIHDYGCYRILGRGFFKIPSLLGGDLNEAQRYLSEAFENTKADAPNQAISRNGANNTYYAEVLKKMGKTAEAKAILRAFIGADPQQLDAAGVLDLKRSQKEAEALLKSW